ncbi:MAG: AAA family ATPase [Succinivibrio sp.]|nr:AAA family ATPase [Succinivibrio sp.]
MPKKNEGIHHKLEVAYPCSEESLSKATAILDSLRYLYGEDLVVDLKDYPAELTFIRVSKEHGGYLIDVAVKPGPFTDPDIPCIKRRTPDNLERVQNILTQVLLEAQLPDPLRWQDATLEVFPYDLDLFAFKMAFSEVRESSDEIYGAFGFRHLMDATSYYVHPDNRSKRAKTSLSQPLGEAIALMQHLYRASTGQTSWGDFLSTPGGIAYLNVKFPADYFERGVIDRRVASCRASCCANIVTIALYDQHGDFINVPLMPLSAMGKYLALYALLFCQEIRIHRDYRHLAGQYFEHPSADLFVKLHEDLYQNHKEEIYRVSYAPLPDEDRSGWSSFVRSWAEYRERQKEQARQQHSELPRFDPSDFNAEVLEFIPNLSSEFVLPENLRPLCAAVTAGDMLSVLLHGPAGTGKTISCKLICREICLPLLATVNCTENLDEFVLGKFLPQEDKIVFKESAVTAAIRSGGAVVFEELNFARPQYLAFLNSLLDDNGFVRLDNGEVVRRHPNFRFFATMNMGYFGTKELNLSLFNRFGAVVEVPELSREAIERMLLARVPSCRPMLSKILGVYEKVRKKIEYEELDAVISPRNLENWVRLAKYEGYLKAAEQTIVQVARSDNTFKDTIRGILRLYKWEDPQSKVSAKASPTPSLLGS